MPRPAFFFMVNGGRQIKALAMAEKYLEDVKFLVVDDNMFIRTTVRLVLRAMGAEIVEDALDGKAALDTLKNFVPDIIVLDWEMKPMNGIEFVRTLRAQQDGPMAFVPVIMLTAYSEPDRVTKARDAGVNEFVVKPFSAKGLFSRVQAVIERPRPFVKVGGYFGPDRRRKIETIDGDDRRKKSLKKVKG